MADRLKALLQARVLRAIRLLHFFGESRYGLAVFVGRLVLIPAQCCDQSFSGNLFLRIEPGELSFETLEVSENVLIKSADKPIQFKE